MQTGNATALLLQQPDMALRHPTCVSTGNPTALRIQSQRGSPPTPRSTKERASPCKLPCLCSSAGSTRRPDQMQRRDGRVETETGRLVHQAVLCGMRPGRRSCTGGQHSTLHVLAVQRHTPVKPSRIGQAQGAVFPPLPLLGETRRRHTREKMKNMMRRRR